MLGLMVVLTFLICVSLDYFLNYRKALRSGVTAEVAGPVPVPATATPVPEPVWVAGYEMPQNLHYHPGHVWVRPIGPAMVEVGVDDFARRLMGSIEKVRLPRVGDYLTQGEAAVGIDASGHPARLVAPVGGEVVEVNRKLKQRPESISEQPYGGGWLYRTRNVHMAANLRNLLSGALARRWMEDARGRLEVKLMAFAGSVLQDGGEPAPDFALHLQRDEWNNLAEDFLLVSGE